MESLKSIVDSYMVKVLGVKEFCDRCLRVERWNGNVVLMVVDAAFNSIGLNYFTAVVPKVEEFENNFVKTGRIRAMRDLLAIDIRDLQSIWKNKRSWSVAKEIASYFSMFDDDKLAFRLWAKNSKLIGWEEDPIGKIKGVGLVTYQYLRMMGGVDTVMPDKIVKRVINEILVKAGRKPVEDDVEFIIKVEEIARLTGYRPIELCWMTWLIQPEGKIMRMKKYSSVLTKI